MRRRKRAGRSGEAVEINLAAMLDMAFQLLMFFILTFSPTPIESQIAAQLPGDENVTEKMLPGAARSESTRDSESGELTITVLASASGDVGDLAIDDAILGRSQELQPQLQRALGERSQCDLVLQVDARLRYQDLVALMDVCMRAGEQTDCAFHKVTFVELRSKQ